MTDGIDHISVPGFEVWCLEDGGAVFDADVFPGLSVEEQQTRLKAADEADIRTAFNAFLIKDADGAMTLMDTGCGGHFGTNGGRLMERLAALEIAPDSIDHLVFSHLHTDHAGGAVVDGAKVFPNAKVHLHADEQAFWAEQEAPGQEMLTVYADAITQVAGGDHIGNGLTVWDLPGHTPGHIGLRVGDELVIIADAVHAQHLQMGEPRLCPIYDEDPVTATNSRLAALHEIAEKGLTFAGCHILGPDKFAKLAEVGDGFVIVPR